MKTPNPTSRVKSPAASFEDHFSKFKPDFRKRRWEHDPRQAHVAVRGKVKLKKARKKLKTAKPVPTGRGKGFKAFLNTLPKHERDISKQAAAEQPMTAADWAITRAVWMEVEPNKSF